MAALSKLSNFMEHSRVLLGNLIFIQLLKKFLAFYGNRRFIIVFTKVHYWSLSLTRCIQYTWLGELHSNGS